MVEQHYEYINIYTYVVWRVLFVLIHTRGLFFSLLFRERGQVEREKH